MRNRHSLIRSKAKQVDALVVELQQVVETIKLDYPAAASTVDSAQRRLGEFVGLALEESQPCQIWRCPKGNVPGAECQIARAGDSSWCETCKLRWDTNDPCPPKCPRDGAVLS